MAEVINFGCRLNAYESEMIKQKSLHLESNVFILNTCSVTAEAEKEAIKKIKKLKKDNPNSKIFVTGCAAQINPKLFAELKEVELVFGNKEKLKDEVYTLIKEGKGFDGVEECKVSSQRHEDKIFFKEREEMQAFGEKVLVNDIFSVQETAGHMFEGKVVTEFEHHTRAFVQIQNGCNHRCTFCIIPFARGNSISVPFGLLVKEIEGLLENGYKEIVLTGVDITDYGKDISESLTLGKMAKRLLKAIPHLPRLRFSSIDVAEIDRDVYDLIANETRFMPYFHISLQSGDDMILKRMKRRHSRKDVLDFTSKARFLRPEVAFGADVIAGFPTETEENFLNSKNLISEASISFCHIFSFSPHKGTPAAKMPQIPTNIIKNRTKILIEEGKKELEKTLHNMVGSVQNVLVESGKNGRCENFAPGFFKEGNPARGQILKTKVTGIEGQKLIFSSFFK